MKQKIVKKAFTFRLSGRIWHVKFRDPTRTPDNPLLGECDVDLATISVHPGLTLDNTIITFFHELFHASVRNITNNNTSVREEPAADCVGEAFYEILPQLLKKAPWLFKG